MSDKNIDNELTNQNLINVCWIIIAIGLFCTYSYVTISYNGVYTVVGAKDTSWYCSINSDLKTCNDDINTGGFYQSMTFKEWVCGLNLIWLGVLTSFMVLYLIFTGCLFYTQIIPIIIKCLNWLNINLEQIICMLAVTSIMSILTLITICLMLHTFKTIGVIVKILMEC